MIYIIRHGQTKQNKSGLLLGRSDVPLNENGRRQAEEAGERFRAEGIRFDKIYSSPLGRAVETAEIAAPGVPVTVDPRLIEIDCGPYEGMNLAKPAPVIERFFRDLVHTPAPKGMEPLESIVSRLGEFLEEIRQEASEQVILISTHAIAMKGALEYLTPESHGRYWSTFIGNCSVYKAEAGSGQHWGIPVEWHEGHRKK